MISADGPGLAVSQVGFWMTAAGLCLATAVGALLAWRRTVLRLSRLRARHKDRPTTPDMAQGLTSVRSLMDALADGIFVAQDHRFVFSNAALPRMLDYGLEEFVGMPFGTVLAPSSLSIWTQRFDARLGSGPEPVRAYEVQFLAKDGRREVPLELVATRADFRGRPAVVGLVRDISERQRMSQELDLHRAHLQDLVAQRTRELTAANASLAKAALFNRQITDATPGAMTYWDHELKCRFANRTYCDWFGVREEEVLGRTRFELFGEVFEGAVLDRLRLALGGEAQHFEFSLGAGEHTQSRLVEAHYAPAFAADGSVQGVYSTAFDISALKFAQNQLLSMNDELLASRNLAESATRAKSAFLANMSHEIRTPMNAILGLSHLLRRSNPAGKDSERLGRINDAAYHLLGLIDGILDLSKIESGHFVLENVDFALDALLARSFALVAESARAKGLELVMNTDHVPRDLRGDPTRLSQALVNLLANAVKFTTSGSVSLVVRVLGRTDESLTLRFEVRDTGPGVAQKSLDRLFQAFEQADASTTRLFGGTGLGLVITRHIARMMGGDAGARSKEGAGSTFWFTSVLQFGGGKRADLKPEWGLTGRRALLVDDLHEAREALGQMLHVMGLRTEVAASGLDALALARAVELSGDAYDVVIVDWLMPGMNGLEVVSKLRVSGTKPRPPVFILASIAADDELSNRSQELGIAETLTKPISFSTLRDCLVRFLVDDARAMPLRTTELDLISEASVRDKHYGALVLLAEDNLVNQEVAKTLMEMAGLTVEIANDGREAVAMARATDYALILMDMQMPEMDGIAATKELRASPRCLHVPIIAMTANAYLEDREACLDAGMNDFLTKPVDPPLLYNVLGRWLELSVRNRRATEGHAGQIHVEGLDTVAGLSYFAGNASAYRNALRTFAASYEGGMTSHTTEPGVEPQDRLQRELHEFSSACAYVGASTLSDRAELARSLLSAKHSAGALAQELLELHAETSDLARRIGAALSKEAAPS